MRDVRHIDHPNLHVCGHGSRLPGIVTNLNVTIISASGNIVASHTTHRTNLNNRVVYCMTWSRRGVSHITGTPIIIPTNISMGVGNRIVAVGNGGNRLAHALGSTIRIGRTSGALAFNPHSNCTSN